jgi:regulator of sigma E protease
LQSLLAFVFVLGVLIFVHELGHFLAARRLGVRVLTFSLGFGPKVLKVRRGDTEYCLSAIPLGGYVKMAGENPEDTRTGRPDEFLSRTKWERFQVLIMGPVMNILLAVVVMTGVLYRGADVPAYETQPPVVGTVQAGSPAEQGGIEPGDRVVSVAGRTVETWERFFQAVMPKARTPVDIVVDRAGATMTFRVTPQPRTRFEMGDIGVMPVMQPQVRLVTSGGPADRAGLAPGDVVVAVNGAKVESDKALVKVINEHADRLLTMTIRRDGATRQVEVTPADQGGKGLIGIQLSPFELRTIEPGFLQAVQMSVERNVEWSTLIFRTLGQLFSGEASPRQLMGPVGIAQLSGDAAATGWVALFGVMAMISLNLGLINLLPIPVLDGGHIFIMALEGVVRRDFSMAVKEKMLLAGFAVLMLLMVTVIYNDLARIEWIGRLLPWR